MTRSGRRIRQTGIDRTAIESTDPAGKQAKALTLPGKARAALTKALTLPALS
jgi:hypothetical protein